MLEPADERFDLANAHIGFREIEWCGSTERRLSRCKPLRRSVGVAFEEFQRLAEKVGGAKQTIGFVREKPTLALPPSQGPAGNVDQVGHRLGRKRDVLLEVFERPILETLLQSFQKSGRIERLEPEKHDVGVRTRRPASKEPSEPYKVLCWRFGAVESGLFNSYAGGGHVAYNYWPYGLARQDPAQELIRRAYRDASVKVQDGRSAVRTASPTHDRRVGAGTY